MKKRLKPSKGVAIRAEWVTFAIALLIVLTLVSLVLWTWATESKAPPLIAVQQHQEIRQEQQQFYVPFEITNSGGGTAESVQVLGELLENGQVVEQGEQQIDFLSSGEKEEGAFVFTRDPRPRTVRLRVASYKLP